MITYPDLEDLLDLRAQKQPIISFYLNTDKSRNTLDPGPVKARNLLKEGKKVIETSAWEEPVRKALLADLEKVENYLSGNLGPGYLHRGLVIFACREANLWRVFELPRPVPSNLIMEYTPHIRPLTLILDEYHRFGTLILDRRWAELYEVYIGEILKLEEAFISTAPALVAVSGIEHPGSGDRGISTHRDEAEMQKHFRRVADVLLHQFHRRHWEYLIIGGQQQILTQFKNFLHPTLKTNLVGSFAAEPGKVRPAKILEEVASIERKVEIEAEKQAVVKLVNSAKGHGLAVLGLKSVLGALKLGAVHILFIEDGWQIQGYLCRKCGIISLDDQPCPDCGEKPDRVNDIVDDLIESALRTGSMIEHIHAEADLQTHGHIGAILRFKVESLEE
jgi:peptide chain release factor subunit 1